MIQPVNAAQQPNPQLLAQQQQWLLMQQQQQQQQGGLLNGQTGALGTGMLLGQQAFNPYLNAGLNAGVNSGNTYSLTSGINLGSPQVATGINTINALAAEANALAPALEMAKAQAQQATALKQQQAQQAAVAAVQQPAATTTAAAPAAAPAAADPNAAAQVAAAPTAPTAPTAPVAQSRQGAAEPAPAAPAAAPTSPTALLAQIAAMPSGTNEQTSIPGTGATVDKTALQGLIATLQAPTPKEGAAPAAATPTRAAAYAETNTPATEAEDPHAGCNHGNEGENASNAPPTTTAQLTPQPLPLPLPPTQAPASTTNPASTGGCQCCPGSGTCPPKQLQASANSLEQLANQATLANQPILPRSAVIPSTGTANPWLSQQINTTQPFSTALSQSAQITANPWLSQQINTNQLQPLVNANGQPVAPVVSASNITSRGSLIRLAVRKQRVKGTDQKRYALMPNPSAALTPEQMASFYTPQQIEAAKATGKDPFYLTAEGYRAQRMMNRKNYYLAYKPPSASKIVKPEYTTFSDGPSVGADFSDGSGYDSSDSSFA
jgi:hypothetical protein